MTQTTDISYKKISKILLVVHIIASFIISLFTGNYEGFLGIMGAIAYTIGNQLIVLISYFLLLYKKINKTGAYFSIGLQVLGSIGIYCTLLINFSSLYLLLGFLCGVLSNTLFITSMVLLLTSNIKDIETAQTTLYSNIKFCRQCGNNLIKGSQFCNKCGTKISWKEDN